MPQLQFSVKPAMLPAVLPHYAVWLWRFLVAGALVYGAFRALDALGVILVDAQSLLLAIIVGVVIGTIISVKHRLLLLHSTRYLFYDTHVVRETKLFSVERQSVPYSHISKVTNNSNLFQRVIGVSDIVLHSTRRGDEDFVLASVRDPDALEHKIYELLKNVKKNDA